MSRMPFSKSLLTAQDSSKLSTERSSKSNDLTGREFVPVGERSPIGLQGTSARRMFHLPFLEISNLVLTTPNTALMLTKDFGREGYKQVPKHEKPRFFEGDTTGSSKVISRKPWAVIW